MTQKLIFRETEYTELWGQSPTESFGQQVSEATRIFLVDWPTRDQAKLDFLGYSEAIKSLPNSGNETYYLSRVTPDYHPDFLRASDNQPYLWADSLTFEPYGIPTDENGQPQYGATDPATVNENGVGVYNKAKMTVHYTTRIYPVLNDDEITQTNGVTDESSLARFVEILTNPTAEHLTLPNGLFKVALQGSPAKGVDIDGNATDVAKSGQPSAPSKVQSMRDITLTWRQVPRRMVASACVMAAELGDGVQDSAFEYAVGRVNITSIWGFPAGTLLCEPMEMTPWRQADGEVVFDVTFHFKYFKAGHNYFLVPDANQNVVYTEISTDGAVHLPTVDAPGVHQYDSYEFRNLFYGYDFSAGKAPTLPT